MADARTSTPSLLNSSIALLGASARGSAEDTVRRIPVEDLVADPDQPRQIFDDSTTREDDTVGSFDALVQSIRTHGVLEPLLVFREPQHDRLLVLAGERRLRAAKVAGLTHVPCLERAIPDLATKLRIQLSENTDRKGLSLYEYAGGLARLVELMGETRTKAEMAAELAMSAQRLSDLLFLVSPKAAPETRLALRLEVIIDAVTARNFNKLEEAQRKALLDAAQDNKRPIRRADLAALHRDQANKAVAGDPDAERTAKIVLPDASTLRPAEEDQAALPSLPSGPPPAPSTVSPKTRPAASGSPSTAASPDAKSPEPLANDNEPPAGDLDLIRLPALTRRELTALYLLLGASAEPPWAEADVATSFLALLEAGM